MVVHWECAPLMLFFAGVCATLQGCGGGGGGGGSHTGTTTTTTMTATSRCVTPPDGSEIAKMLNKQYYSFDPKNRNSGKGVYLRSAEDPKIYCGGKCFSPGVADCRISGSMFNSKNMITKTAEKTTIAFGFGKLVAWYVNQTQIETKLGKCSFVWDGGTMAKYNYGCGCNPGINGCDNPGNPFNNMDKDTGYTKPNTGKSKDVASCACENRPNSSWPTTWGHGPDCFWKGPAYYPPDGYVKDDTWDMLKWRVDHQDYAHGGMDQGKDPVAFWNEIVLDARELLKALKEDYVAAMPAIVYTKGKPGAREKAQGTAKYIAENYGSCTPATPVPVIALDTEADITNGADIFISEASADMDSQRAEPVAV